MMCVWNGGRGARRKMVYLQGTQTPGQSYQPSTPNSQADHKRGLPIYKTAIEKFMLVTEIINNEGFVL